MRTSGFAKEFKKIIALFYSLLCMAFACISCVEDEEVALNGISESMRQGVEQKYGYIIPDNAQLMEGRITTGMDYSLLLCYSLELDELEGYNEGMQSSDVYLLLWEEKKSDVEYNTNCSFEGIEEFENKYGVKFSFFSICDRVHYTGMALSKPKNGKIFVYIDGYRPASSWYD